MNLRRTKVEGRIVLDADYSLHRKYLFCNDCIALRTLALLSFCLALLLPHASCAKGKLVVFGDSLSDNGNAYALSEGKNPPEPYGDTYDESGKTFPGRWTDGQNWVDYFPCFAPDFPPATPFFADRLNGTNVAIAGSTSADLLSVQIPAYTAERVSGEDLYVIGIGANDFSARIDPAKTVANIKEGIATLFGNGARNFVVINVPDLSLTPQVKALGGATILAAKRFVYIANILLEVELLRFAFLHRISIDLVDINAIFIPLVFNPGRFGFTNSTDAALTAQGVVSNPNEYVFWDGFHPTTKVHRIAAEFIYKSLFLRRRLNEFLSRQ